MRRREGDTLKTFLNKDVGLSFFFPSKGLKLPVCDTAFEGSSSVFIECPLKKREVSESAERGNCHHLMKRLSQRTCPRHPSQEPVPYLLHS